MATKSNLVSISGSAAADYSSSGQYTFMDINSSGNFVQQSAAGAACVGVLQNNPGSGHEATVAIAGESKVVAGATLSPGNRVQSNASGQAIAAASGDMAQGIVKQGASSGNLATIVLQPNSGQVN